MGRQIPVIVRQSYTVILLLMVSCSCSYHLSFAIPIYIENSMTAEPLYRSSRLAPMPPTYDDKSDRSSIISTATTLNSADMPRPAFLSGELSDVGCYGVANILLMQPLVTNTAERQLFRSMKTSMQVYSLVNVICLLLIFDAVIGLVRRRVRDPRKEPSSQEGFDRSSRSS